MADRSGLLARFATAVAEAPGTRSLTWRLCEAARRVLGADGASMTMDLGPGNRVTLCATDDVAGRLEDLHDVLGEGPALEAYRSGGPVTLTVGSRAAGWSAFEAAVARQTGAVVVVAVPMRLDSTVLGVLLLHRAGVGTLAEPPEHVELLADALAAALLSDYAGTRDVGPGTPWSSRAEIHQATGMVVAQLRVGVGDALAILRAHAFALDRPLADVARAVLDRTIDFRTQA